MNIQEFLGRAQVHFEVLQHPQTFDVQHLAQSVHVSGHHVAKTVMLRTDNANYIVAVLPATHHIDFVKARAVLQATTVELASELEVAQRCPDCEVGALPPFGSQYDMQTVVDSPLTTGDAILFEGTNHTEAIRMRCSDFLDVERPLVAAIS